jgi:nicotinate-nucleotide adenylyltransferase
MSDGRTLGLLGGTFDPIHYGHLDAADAACEVLSLDEMVFIPSHDPPHRPIDPRASSFHRFALAALAVNDRRTYRVSDQEMAREGQSYTFDTLGTLHEEGWRPSQLFFILGADAFAEIASWYRYPAVLNAAHFVVVARPGTTTEKAFARVPELRSRLAPPGTRLTDDTRIFVIERDTRDVSSTLIRDRLAARESIDDLVPTAVARHISTHHLYGAVGRLHGESD